MRPRPRVLPGVALVSHQKQVVASSAGDGPRDREEVGRVRRHPLHHIHGHATDHRGDHVCDRVVEVPLHSANGNHEAVAIDASSVASVTFVVDVGSQLLGQVPIQPGSP